MEIITIYSVLSNMTTKSVMKEKILGILLHSTVNKLTEDRKNEEVHRQSKNGGTGMKNPSLKANINKILGELNPEKEISVPEVKNTEQISNNQSETHSDHRETHNKPTNPSLAETIHKLEAGSDYGTGSSSVDTTVGPSKCDSESPGACYGLWFNSGDPYTHVREY